MNMRGIAAEYRLEHWAQIMRERNESGLSIKEFCKNAGMHVNRFFYWQKRLREAACEHLTKMQEKTKAVEPMRPMFAEVKLQDNFSEVIHTGPALQMDLMMEVSGVKITTNRNYPIDQLAYLLRELVKLC